MKHYIITNRAIETTNGREIIKQDGKEMAGDTLRFAIYDTDADKNNLHGRYELLPDMPNSAFISEENNGLIKFKNPYQGDYEKMTPIDLKKLKGSESLFADLFLQLKSSKSDKSDVLLLFMDSIMI